jgi:hypothetical protein
VLAPALLLPLPLRMMMMMDVVYSLFLLRGTQFEMSL